MPTLNRRPFALLFAAALPMLAGCAGSGRPSSTETSSSQLSFGVSMAKRELWNEALFRFHEAEKLDPANPHIQNNLGVAYEAVGEFDKALTHYQQALKADPASKEMKANYARFVEFYQSFKGKQSGAGVTAQSQGVKPSRGPLDPPAGEPLPAQRPPTIVEPPSTPEDTPPPPADTRPR